MLKLFSWQNKLVYLSKKKTSLNNIKNENGVLTHSRDENDKTTRSISNVFENLDKIDQGLGKYLSLKLAEEEIDKLHTTYSVLNRKYF